MTSELGFLNGLYSPELTAASLAKFRHNLAVSFEHSPRCEKFESQNFKNISWLLSTCQEKLMEELLNPFLDENRI